MEGIVPVQSFQSVKSVQDLIWLVGTWNNNFPLKGRQTGGEGVMY